MNKILTSDDVLTVPQFKREFFDALNDHIFELWSDYVKYCQSLCDDGYDLDDAVVSFATYLLDHIDP